MTLKIYPAHDRDCDSRNTPSWKYRLPQGEHSVLLELQKGYDWTGEGQVLFRPASDHPVLEVDFNVEKEEYRGLMLRMTYAEDYGIYRIFLDGQNIRQPEDYMVGEKIEDYDFYSKTLQVKDHYLGSLKLAPGKHTLKFEYVGRNPLQQSCVYSFFKVIRLLLILIAPLVSMRMEMPPLVSSASRFFASDIS